jgi:hypothetical protein
MTIEQIIGMLDFARFLGHQLLKRFTSVSVQLSVEHDHSEDGEE